MIEILKGKVVPEKVGEADIFSQVYNPDVLLCLANLSNDEVFTPPEVANQMLDMLPQGLFEDPNTKFLDPACKSGVFLREIAKRLIKGLEDKIPDLQERIDHICKEQLYGIAITELTSLLSRRSVYCSKYPNGPFSIAHFDNVEGNIRFKNCKHEWEGEKNLWTFEHGEKVRVWRKCKWCGASEELYGDERRKDLEYHAYEFLHLLNPEEIFNMKFDVICSNPPYQLSTTDSSQQAKPLYHLFVEQAQKLNPRFMTMIIPARWFSGGIGLEKFRDNMLNDGHISKLVDYANSKDCFSGVSISGGVCYFLWERERKGDCVVTNIIGDNENTQRRILNEFSTFIRYNNAITIVHKVARKKEPSISIMTSAVSPFGLSTKIRGEEKESKTKIYPLHSSKGISYLGRDEIPKGNEWLGHYKVLVSQTGAEHAGEPSKDGKFRVLTSSMKTVGKNDVCTHSYILIGPFDTKTEAQNCETYLKTKFVRFLILQAVSSIHISKQTFIYVPVQNFKEEWDDKKLYEKYGIDNEEIQFIDSMIKPFDGGGD